jgi:hypothetical protein
VAALLIAGRTETDAPHGTLTHVVGVFLMCLDVRSELNHGMFGGKYVLSGHNVARGVGPSDSVIGRKSIEPENCIFDEVNEYNPWEVTEWQHAVSTVSAVFDI